MQQNCHSDNFLDQLRAFPPPFGQSPQDYQLLRNFVWKSWPGTMGHLRELILCHAYVESYSPIQERQQTYERRYRYYSIIIVDVEIEIFSVTVNSKANNKCQWFFKVWCQIVSCNKFLSNCFHDRSRTLERFLGAISFVFDTLCALIIDITQYISVYFS